MATSSAYIDVETVLAGYMDYTLLLADKSGTKSGQNNTPE